MKKQGAAMSALNDGRWQNMPPYCGGCVACTRKMRRQGVSDAWVLCVWDGEMRAPRLGRGLLLARQTVAACMRCGV
jgi:hypothetical protein